MWEEEGPADAIISLLPASCSYQIDGIIQGVKQNKQLSKVRMFSQGRVFAVMEYSKVYFCLRYC